MMIFLLDKVKLWCGARKTMRRLLKAKTKAKVLTEQRDMEAEMTGEAKQ